MLTLSSSSSSSIVVKLLHHSRGVAVNEKLVINVHLRERESSIATPPPPWSEKNESFFLRIKKKAKQSTCKRALDVSWEEPERFQAPSCLQNFLPGS